jgi:hypothetical protein
MLLNDDDVNEFIAIYREEFGEELDPGSARILATQLLRLFTVLARPLPCEQGRPIENSELDVNLKKPTE